MIQLYFRPTANGHKVTIFLEEAGLDYRLTHMADVEGGHFGPEFLRISPNNKMPAILDHAPADGGPPLAMFESGAILVYLAEKTGRFLPADPRPRAEAMQWLMWQMGGLGPMSGQNGHFRHQAPPPADPYASGRYLREVTRLYTVLDYRLRHHTYVAGDYGVADMACHPWIATHEIQGVELEDYPDLKRWYDLMGRRPAVQRAYANAAYAPSARLNDADHKVRYQQTGEMLRAAYARMEAETEAR